MPKSSKKSKRVPSLSELDSTDWAIVEFLAAHRIGASIERMSECLNLKRSEVSKRVKSLMEKRIVASPIGPYYFITFEATKLLEKNKEDAPPTSTSS